MKYWFLLFMVTSLACDMNSDCDYDFECKNNECVHKSLFPITSFEIIGSLLILITSGLANAAGIGGGALFVIYFITFFGYNASDAVALSQFNIAGGSMTAILIKVFLRHPTKNKPLIEYDIALQLLSPILIGASIGVIINIILPYWLILVILVSLLSLLSVNTVKSAIKQYKKETMAMNQPNLLIKTPETQSTPGLSRIYEIEKRILPSQNFFFIFCIFSFVIFCSFIRGSRTFTSFIGLSFCSLGFWLVSVLIILILVFISYQCGLFIIRKYEYKVSEKYEFDSQDIHWSKRNCLIISAAGLGAGLIGSIIGIGGALVMSPVFLKMGMRPEVMTATTSFMILFSSVVTALQYAIAGKINFAYGFWTICFALTGSAIGVFFIKKLVEKYKRSSLIIMTLAAMQIICCFVILVYGTYNYVHNDEDYGFHSYCR